MENEKRQLIGLIEHSFSDEVDSDLVAAAKEHFNKCRSLNSLVFDWVNQSRSVIIANADCDPGEEYGFLIYLKENDTNLAQVVISMDWLHANYPDLLPATDIDDDIETFEKSWCSSIGRDIISREDILKVIVSYLFAEYSQITVDGDLSFLLDCCSEEELKPIEGKQVICVAPNYRDPKTLSGFGAHYWSFQ